MQLLKCICISANISACKFQRKCFRVFAHFHPELQTAQIESNAAWNLFAPGISARRHRRRCSCCHELMSAQLHFSDIERPRPARLSSASLTRPDEYYFCWHSRLAARAAAAMSARLQELRRKKRIRDLKLAAEARYSSLPLDL